MSVSFNCNLWLLMPVKGWTKSFSIYRLIYSRIRKLPRTQKNEWKKSSKKRWNAPLLMKETQFKVNEGYNCCQYISLLLTQLSLHLFPSFYTCFCFIKKRYLCDSNISKIKFSYIIYFNEINVFKILPSDILKLKKLFST